MATAEIDAVITAACQQDWPLLIGVRHHSAALARVLPQLLDDQQPERLLIEMPAELEPWFSWLGHEETRTPVALVCTNGQRTGLYPFADFSPELAAIRWAMANDVPITACDLPYRLKEPDGASAPDRPGLDLVMRQHECRDQGELWERLVEDRQWSGSAEDIRQAAIHFGYLVRAEDPAGPRDQARETWMRRILREHASSRCAVIVGAYHVPAFIGTHADADLPEPDDAPIETALIPYTAQHLDERSGYPAGVRDPAWQQAVFTADGPADQTTTVIELMTKVTRDLRERGHGGSTAELQESIRLARDLARLRGLPAPGRRELLEGLRTALGQGQALGRLRQIGLSAQSHLVGTSIGRLPADCPRQGVERDVPRILTALKLPTEISDKPTELRLDPLRSHLDQMRAVFLERLEVLGISYGKRRERSEQATREHLTIGWDVAWTSATPSTCIAASIHGATVEQAAAGLLHRQLDTDQDATWVSRAGPLIHQAARCGFGAIVDQVLRRLWQTSTRQSLDLALTLHILELIDTVDQHHIPGLPATTVTGSITLPAYHLPAAIERDDLLDHALQMVPGLSGSDQIDDARTLVRCWLWLETHHYQRGRDAIHAHMRSTNRSGSPLMQGTAAGLLLRAGAVDDAATSQMFQSWITAASQPETRAEMRARITGWLIAIPQHILPYEETRTGLHRTLALLSDQNFLDRLPALRGAFTTLTPGDRQVLLRQFRNELNADQSLATIQTTPEQLAAWATADQAAINAAIALTGAKPTRTTTADDDTDEPTIPAAKGGLPLIDRWALILGDTRTSTSQRTAGIGHALDDLYGRERGDLLDGQSDALDGGDGKPRLTIREWADALEADFSSDVCQEVLAQAAELGRPQALLAIDPEQARPSVALVEQALQLRGSAGPAQLHQLRTLIATTIKALQQSLAVRLRPAMAGLLDHQPRRRPSPRLHMPRTIAANLHRARQIDDGWQLVPDRLFFRGQRQAQMDWHLILAVDVSGSMEASTIHAALMAAIFAGLPAIDVTFLTFSTVVGDFSEHASDPLELLMSVQIGGGTNIGLGLHHARQRLVNPRRSLVITISDWAEGCSVGGLLDEVGQLVATGATCLGIASLDASGHPRYHTGIAQQVVAAGMPVAALGPVALARWVRDQVQA